MIHAQVGKASPTSLRGDSGFRSYTPPNVPKAVDVTNTNAFTSSNAIIANAGEYDPSSAEGQFLLAHELAHVQQQTEAPLSMMPKPDAELEIDPDPQLEREADQAAKEALSGEEPLTVSRLGTDVHVQRLPKYEMFTALAMFELENESGSVGSFQQSQNARRANFLKDAIRSYREGMESNEQVETDQTAQEFIEHHVQESGGEVTDDGAVVGAPAAEADLDGRHEEILELDFPSESEMQERKAALEQILQDKLDQVALTDEQRDKLEAGIDTSLFDELSVKLAFELVSLVSPRLAKLGGLTKTVISNMWGLTNGDIVERAQQIQEELESEVTGQDSEKVNF